MLRKILNALGTILVIYVVVKGVDGIVSLIKIIFPVIALLIFISYLLG